jgi:hypothetical protein
MIKKSAFDRLYNLKRKGRNKSGIIARLDKMRDRQHALIDRRGNQNLPMIVIDEQTALESNSAPYYV